jgi:hypothetical protein
MIGQLEQLSPWSWVRSVGLASGQHRESLYSCHSLTSQIADPNPDVRISLRTCTFKLALITFSLLPCMHACTHARKQRCRSPFPLRAGKLAAEEYVHSRHACSAASMDDYFDYTYS